MLKKFILLTSLLCSCTSVKDVDETSVLKLSASDTESVALGDFAKNVKFLKLSTVQNSFIGNIDKIVLHKNNIYILDARITSALYVYTNEGDLKYKIANYGRGPGEFMGPYDFAIDEKEREIIIYDARSLKLCYYDLNNGEYLREINIDFQFARFSVAEENLIFFLNNIASKYNHNILVTDKKLNVIKKILELNSNMIGYYYSLPINFTSYNSTEFITLPSDYNIYSFSNGIFSKLLKVDFGKDALPASYYDKHPNNRSRREEIGKAAYHLSNYFESDKFRFFMYRKGDVNSHYYLQSKSSGKIIHTGYDQLIDDIGAGPLIRWPMAIKGESLIWYQQTATLIRYLNAKKKELNKDQWREFLQTNKKLLAFAETLSENDNPYLIFMEIDF